MKNKFIDFFKNHKIVFICFFIFFIYILPHLAMSYLIYDESEGNSEYDPIIGDGDLIIYTGRIHQFSEGKLPLNIYTEEDNKFPYFVDFGLEFIYFIYSLIFLGSIKWSNFFYT